MVVLGVAITAAIGAILRVAMTNHDGNFTRQVLTTGAVNIVGSFLLGWLAGSSASANTLAIVGVGGLGSFTTFSTYISQIDHLTRTSNRRDAVLYGVSSLVLGISAAYLGWLL